MREILFRGKSNWTYGSVKEGDWLYSMTIAPHCYSDNKITSYYIGGGNNSIDAKTLGQYTGLTDKNGNKVFEGDIVVIDHTIRTYSWDEIPETYKPRRSHSVGWNDIHGELIYKRNYAVEWKEKDARWILRNGSDQHDLREIFLHFHNGVVVGNIHDNPELLKGGDAK